MRNYLVATLLLATLFACNDKKKTKGDEPAEVVTFFNKYEKLKLPFSVTDTDMNRYDNKDTIDFSRFAKFVPDTIFIDPFGKTRNLIIKPIGKIEAKNQETYLATLLSSKNDSAIYLTVFNKGKFSANMPLIVTNEDAVTDEASIDKKLSIVINKEWTVKNDIKYKRVIYAYNNIGMFTTILTETNEERSKTVNAIINPLDTFPKKNKYSGDYIKDKNAFLSIRDAKTPSQYLFYIHFQNQSENEEPCSGELKGTLTMTSDKEGTFSQTGDPCSIDFKFSGNNVTIKENGNCGNFRGIKCFFNDTFTRRKETKAAKKKK